MQRNQTRYRQHHNNQARKLILDRTSDQINQTEQGLGQQQEEINLTCEKRNS